MASLLLSDRYSFRLSLRKTQLSGLRNHLEWERASTLIRAVVLKRGCVIMLLWVKNTDLFFHTCLLIFHLIYCTLLFKRFLKNIFVSLRLQLFDQTYSKNHNIVKFYNLYNSSFWTLNLIG